MIYKTNKNLKLKFKRTRRTRTSKKTRKNRKKYKGGSVETLGDISDEIGTKNKGNQIPGTGDPYVEMLKAISRKLYSTHYNVKFMDALKGTYTFAQDYFVEEISALCTYKGAVPVTAVPVNGLPDNGIPVIGGPVIGVPVNNNVPIIVENGNVVLISNGAQTSNGVQNSIAVPSSIAVPINKETQSSTALPSSIAVPNNNGVRSMYCTLCVRNNYSALCILARLFYSKEIATTYSYFTLQKNIIENCVTMYNIEKQKSLLNSTKKKSNNDIYYILNIEDKGLKTENGAFYNLLAGIMDDGTKLDPITKLKNMEHPKSEENKTEEQKKLEYASKVYTKVEGLNSAFQQCIVPKPPKLLSQKEIREKINEYKQKKNMSKNQLFTLSDAKSAAKIGVKGVIKGVQKQAEAEKKGIKKVLRFSKKQDGLKGGAAALASMPGGAGAGALLNGKGAASMPGGAGEKSMLNVGLAEMKSSTQENSKHLLLFYQAEIEKLFIKGDVDYSYIILFILNNIFNKPDKLKLIHNDIPFINNNDFCDKFYKILEQELLTDSFICANEANVNLLLS